MTAPFHLPPVTDIVVSIPPGQMLAAELRGGEVWGLHWHFADAPSLVGGVHAVRITRLAPEAKGAFAIADEAGTEAFLDLSKAKAPPHEGERVYAQVTREPENGKRLTLRPDVRLAGRYLVYTPSRAGLSVSRQIRGKEKARTLQGVLRHDLAPGEGVIVRAAALILHDASASLRRELELHRQHWHSAMAKTGLGQILPPLGPYESLITERNGAAPLTISVNSPHAKVCVNRALARWAPTEKVHVLQEASNLFEACGADEAFHGALQPHAPLPSGGSIWIEPTRACWAIDIDSGNMTDRSVQNARFGVNQTAAVEIARQVRLRRLAGNIVVDFLRMNQAKAEQSVIATLQAAFAEDPAALHFNSHFDELGLYAFSRQRLGRDFTSRGRHGGGWIAVLEGLNALSRQSLSNPASRLALALSPRAGKLVPDLPKAIAETRFRIGREPVIVIDERLGPEAFEIRSVMPGTRE